MTNVAIAGADDTGRRLWEALTASGGVDVTAFVDDSRARRPGREFLGLPVHPVEWLSTGRCDVVVVPDRQGAPDLHWLGGAGGCTPRVVRLPIDPADEVVLACVAERFPDPLAPVLAAVQPTCRARLGVFGTGAAAIKVWEACMDIDDVEIVWFADNDARQQGRRFLWQEVIAPADIPARPVDVIVIGSMSREPIRAQLRALGVPPGRIAMPRVTESTERIYDDLSSWLPQHVGPRAS